MTTVASHPASGGDGPDPRLPLPLDPTLFPIRTKNGLITPKILKVADSLEAMTVDYNLATGLPRHEWTIPPAALSVTIAFVNARITEAVDIRCGDVIDPVIEKIEDQGADIDDKIQALVERDSKVISAETGVVRTEEDAVEQVGNNQDKMTADKRRGYSHHRRVARWLRVLGKIMPYGEALGLVVLLSYFLNVEWTHPTEDPLTWTLSVVIVLATLLFTPRVVERSGEGWNKRREAEVESQTGAKRSATRKLLVNGAIATLISLAIVAGLVERALAVADDTMPQSMLVLVIALCVIAGLAMPGVAFIAIAWDGSSLSRENDSLVDQLDDGLEEDQQLRSEANSLHQACEQDELRINTKVAPAVLQIAKEGAEELRWAYAWVQVRICTSSALPSRPVEEPAEDAESISTGIPGADPIRLEPLVNRGRRLKELQRRRHEAMAKLNALPPHPWSGNQNVL